MLLVLLIFALEVALGYLLYAGFTYGWPPWTGFGEYNSPPTAVEKKFERAKTLWDWMQLFIVPLVLAIAAFILNRTQQKNAEKAARQRDETERTIAEKRNQDAILETYLDRMAELLIDQKLLKSQPDDEVRDIARIRTLTALRRLDGDRNKILIQFLRDAGLFGEQSDPGKPIIDMSRANLQRANLSGADLSGANLLRSDLAGANLHEAVLQKADLHEAVLQKADLEGAWLHGANLQKADLEEAALSEAELEGADLRGAHLRGAHLRGAHLKAANLQGADLQGADLRWAKLQKADLHRLGLRETNAQKANLRGANLQGADLRGANLQGADLQGATMPDGSKHE